MSMWYLYALTVLGVAITQFTIFFPYQRKALIRWFKKRKPKYKLAQRVRVKQLKYDQKYGRKDDTLKVWMNMTRYVGSVVTIVEVYNNGLFFNIKEDDGEDTWHADMFEPLKIKKEDAFEALLHGHISDEEYKAIMNVGGVVNYVRSWRYNRAK